jgi:hypothetical protein
MGAMMIRTSGKSVYYPVSGQRAEVIRGSLRVRYFRGSLLVNAKCVERNLRAGPLLRDLEKAL